MKGNQRFGGSAGKRQHNRFQLTDVHIARLQRTVGYAPSRLSLTSTKSFVTINGIDWTWISQHQSSFWEMQSSSYNNSMLP